MTSFRSTTLNMADRHCPGALDHYEANVPYDRDIFAVGIAAHAFLQTAIEGGNLDTMAESLAVHGRSFDGVPEPVLAPTAIADGLALARRWLDDNPPSRNERAEVGMGVAEDLTTPAPYATSYLRCILDVLDVNEEDQGDGYDPITVVRIRDWKSAFPTDASELDSLQLHIQTVIAAANHPTASIIRREVVNLRTRAIYSIDLFLDDAGLATLERWRQEIRLAIAQASMAPRPFRPGVGCMGCPYLVRCPTARAYHADSALAGPPEDIATRYAVADAMRERLGTAVKALAGRGSIAVPGGTVGYEVKTKREYHPGSAEHILADWQADPNRTPAGLIEAMKPGAKQIKAVATKLFTFKRGEGDDYKHHRADFEAAHLITKNVAKFGCHRPTDASTEEDDSE